VVTPRTALMPSAQTTQQALSGELHLDKSNGWIMWKSDALVLESTRLCWLPIELRGKISASHEGTFVLASESTHQLTIIDFAPMLKSLYEKGIIY
jgi:hypothetical protein